MKEKRHESERAIPICVSATLICAGTFGQRGDIVFVQMSMGVHYILMCMYSVCMRGTDSYSTIVWNIKYSAVLAAVIKSRGSIAGV